MNKNNLKVGTRVTFYPVDGAAYSSEGTIVSKHPIRKVRYFMVRVTEGTGSNDGKGKEWLCRPSDIISFEPKPGAWTMGGLV